MTPQKSAPICWITVALIVGVTMAWGMVLFGVAAISPILAVALLIPMIALHSSLQHEVLHGHPFANPVLNAALVWPAFGLFIPYARFRDLHLKHHYDPDLTDPYEDPETNYFDPVVWADLPRGQKWLLRVQNTLAGRMILGPITGIVRFLLAELQIVRAGDSGVARVWLAHIPAVAVVVAAVWLSPLSGVSYLLAVYGAMSILKLRTFLEHQAADRVSGRTAIVEGRGIFAFLFLNNNLHVVHHMHPHVSWHKLPALYARNRAHYLRRNGGYVYASYAKVFEAYFLRAKDPVPHPLWSKPIAAAIASHATLDPHHVGSSTFANPALHAAKAPE